MGQQHEKLAQVGKRFGAGIMSEPERDGFAVKPLSLITMRKRETRTHHTRHIERALFACERRTQ